MPMSTAELGLEHRVDALGAQVATLNKTIENLNKTLSKLSPPNGQVKKVVAPAPPPPSSKATGPAPPIGVIPARLWKPNPAFL
jgi:hypothetical protein